MTPASGSVPNLAICAATNAIRSIPGSRRGLLMLGLTALGLGLVFKWNWLVVAGIAPLLLTVLPCIVMCALGMSKMSGGSAGSRPSPGDNAPEPAPTTADASDRLPERSAFASSRTPLTWPRLVLFVQPATMTATTVAGSLGIPSVRARSFAVLNGRMRSRTSTDVAECWERRQHPNGDLLQATRHHQNADAHHHYPSADVEDRSGAPHAFQDCGRADRRTVLQAGTGCRGRDRRRQGAPLHCPPRLP